MVQYINFTYIFYDKTSENVSDVNKKNLFNLILKYHYPCCMNITTQAELSDEIKQEIIQDEHSLFTKKINEYNENYKTKFSFYAIPRVLYDLFVILFTFNGIISTHVNEFSQSVVYSNYIEYCNIVNIYHNQLIEIFWIINNSIHSMINVDMKINLPF